MRFSNLLPKRITPYLFVLSLIFACSEVDEELETVIINPWPVEPSPKAYVYLDENGVTMKASENSKPGDRADFEGDTYLIVDDEILRELVRGYPSNDVDLSKLVTTKVTDMNELFYNRTGYNFDLSNWDVSNVTDMSNMFYNAFEFNSDISNWDVSSVTNMAKMFHTATSFNQNIGNWDVSNVADMSNMFMNASEFNSDISNWDVSNVTDMGLMFAWAQKFNQDLSNWNVENVTNDYWFDYSTGSWTLPKPNFQE